MKLPDGTKTTNDSQEYLLYCEALTLAKWKFKKRREFLDKLEEKKHSSNRVLKLKYWLKLFWDKKIHEICIK